MASLLWISLDATSETSAVQLIQFCAIMCQPEQTLKYSIVLSEFKAISAKPKFEIYLSVPNLVILSSVGYSQVDTGGPSCRLDFSQKYPDSFLFVRSQRLS